MWYYMLLCPIMSQATIPLTKFSLCPTAVCPVKVTVSGAVDRLILYPFKNTNPQAFQELEPIQNVVVKLFLGIGCGKLSDLHITHTHRRCSIAIFDRHSAEILFSIIKPDEGMLRFMMLKRNTNIMSD